MTTTTKALELQIAQLTNEHNFKTLIADTLPNIKTLAFLTGHDKEVKRLVATCNDANDFKTVLSAFPPTNTNTVIGTATDKYFADMKTPYKVNIDNPCNPSQYHNFSVEISYQSNDIEVSCKLPIDAIKDYTNTGERAITDSEHHYFIGYSYQRLASIRVREYRFKDEQISWYGGNKTLKNENKANEIVNTLLA